jgi:hypothetical protein
MGIDIKTDWPTDPRSLCDFDLSLQRDSGLPSLSLLLSDSTKTRGESVYFGVVHDGG